MAEWYYSLGTQQKGPVSLDVLRQLAASGKLQRVDMVWREGMIEWQKAGQVDGIFSRAEAPVRRRAPADEIEPLRRRSQSVEVVDDEDDLDDDRPQRKKKRRKERSPAAMAGIIGGSIGGGILVLIIVIVLLVRSGRGDGAGDNGRPAALQGGNVYTVTLRPGQDNMRTFTFQQGKRVEVLVRTPQGWLRNPDVDLFITRTGDQGFELADEDISKDCYLEFIVPVTDQYMIEVTNLGPGAANCTVTIRES